jgi:hypothetical protein
LRKKGELLGQAGVLKQGLRIAGIWGPKRANQTTTAARDGHRAPPVTIFSCRREELCQLRPIVG